MKTPETPEECFLLLVGLYVSATLWKVVWQYVLSSLVEHLPSMCKTLGLIPSAVKKKDLVWIQGMVQW